MMNKLLFSYVPCCMVIIILLETAHGYIPVSPNMRTFSSAIKGGRLPANEEKVLYEHNSGQPGVITEQWFTGVNVMDENARIRIYVDNETVASIDFMLFLAHGIGSGESDEKANLPWGIKRMGHAADGAVYNTYRIPFTSSVKITATHPKGGTFWYIIRGVENYPLILGDLMLPANTKLKLYKNIGVSLKPRDFITLADVKSPGAVFLVTLAASSADFNYLEACMRAVIDGSPTTTFLSSGTEDFFLSGYYFNKGIYHFDNSGCTFITKTNATMSAYKFFENDPLLFTKSLQLMWRCGETANGNDGCPNDYPPPSGPAADAIKSSQLSDTVVTTYTWIYEW